MTREELVEAVTEALYLSPGLEVLPPDTDWEHVVAAATVDVVVPMVTAALAEHFADEAARLDARVNTSGYALGIEVGRERDNALRVARFIRGWRPQ